MKKTKLLIAPSYDFELLGLATSLRAHTLAFWLNKKLNIQLKRVDDHEMYAARGEKLFTTMFKQMLEHGYLVLIQNRGILQSGRRGYLLPELKQMDYFFLIEDESVGFDPEFYLERMRTCPGVQLVFKLDIRKLKSKDNLITY
ncbi:MAG: IPExxxVDY family protein [Nitritalea sp.]